MYILNIIFNVFKLLDAPTKAKYVWLQIFFLVSALIQIIGVASMAPFIGILSNPEIIHSNIMFSMAYEYFSFASDIKFIVAFALTSLALIFISNLIAGVTMWLTFRFSIIVGTKLQNNLFHSFLNREYVYHKMANHTNAIALVNQEAPRFVYMVMQPFLILTSQIFIASIILLGLIILDPVVALGAGVVVGGSYLVTYIVLRRSLVRHGKVMSERNNGVQATLSEAFMGIKEIMLSGKEKIYHNRFDGFNKRGLVSHSFIALAGDIPKLVIETISFGAILILAISLLISLSSESDVMSMLSLYALAGYKLLPSMQQIYKSISSISANGAVVEKLASELETPVTVKPENTQAFNEVINSVALSDVSFNYPGSDINVIDSINVIFHKGSINTIAGPSGSGKSTLADLLLGLLQPNGGSLLVNDKKLNEDNLYGYQRAIGYVPQNIFLMNDTVVANVAFGVDHEKIDKARVIRALKLANAEEFVNHLPKGKDSILGQDGKLISGGQRQRIGIARALYNDTKILVLDEPTSALDIHSEYEFMNCLSELKNTMLIILVSHRPVAIKLSDNICIVDSGKVQATGSYNDLIKTNTEFQQLMLKANANTD